MKKEGVLEETVNSSDDISSPTVLLKVEKQLISIKEKTSDKNARTEKSLC